MNYNEARIILENLKNALLRIPARGKNDRQGKQLTNEAFEIAINLLKEKEKDYDL